MTRRHKIILSALVAVIFLPASLSSQAQERKRSLGPYTMYEQIIYPAKQMRIMEWLADDMNEGRATGTISGQRVAWAITDMFRQYGLEPLFGSSFFQPFIADSLSGTRGRNVVGIKNIIFAALDAKELNMAGSKALVGRLQEREMTDSFLCAINIDQIGTVIEPVHEADTNFVIVLGEQTLRKENRGLIDMCNRYYNIGLDIDHTFYGRSSPPASTATPTRPPTTRTSSPTR